MTTPTNDAPMTVEHEPRHDLIGYYARQRPEQADRDIANDVLEHSFDDKRMFTFRDLVLIATRSREATEERLAALASAPAVGSHRRGCTYNFSDPRCQCLASAPAGDGVERELTPALIASARGHLANVRAHGNAEANACMVFEAVLDAAAALARPRAAVRERRSDSNFAWIVPRHPTDAMVQAGLYHCTADMGFADLFTAFHYMVDEAQQDDAILALQSPPAKGNEV